MADLPEPLPEPFMDVQLGLPGRLTGKVRISYPLPDERRLFITTDRLSAFDRVLGGVPWKGQVLNELSAWWCGRCADIVDHHVLAVPDQNCTVAVDARPLRVEVVVRGHITGVTDTALWTRYAAGARTIDGHRLPDGLHKHDRLPTPIITPTTKSTTGGHDEPLSPAQVVELGLVDASLWDDVCSAALALFQRGQQVAAGAGLILADTKYEFGQDVDGRLLLIDEVHTPDSSRYWVAATFDERRGAGEEPESLDKEPVRRALSDAGYRGDGEPPTMPRSVWTDTCHRYVEAYERLTGTNFEPGAYPVEARLTQHLNEEGLL